MNRTHFFALLTCAAAMLVGQNAAQATPVNAFFSFDTEQNGTGAFDGLVTANNLPVAPTITRTGTNQSSNGGESLFVDFEGNAWLGGGNFNLPGHSLAWSPPATGSSMTINLDMNSLQDLSIRVAIRSAQNNATPPSAFTAIEFDTGSGFMDAATGAALNFTAANTFQEYNLDLSSLSDINFQSNVAIRFTLADLPASTSFRIDNVQLSANLIPEPATATLGLMGVAGLVMRRRRVA